MSQRSATKGFRGSQGTKADPKEDTFVKKPVAPKDPVQSPNPITDELTKKGRDLNYLLLLNTADSSHESKFKGFDELAQNGWSESRDTEATRNHSFRYRGLEDMCKSLQVDYECGVGTRNKVVRFCHDQVPGSKNGQCPSKGFYILGLNPRQHILLGFDAYSPRYMVDKENSQNRTKYNIPELRKWSDVAFLGWKKASNGNLKAPKYVLWASVTSKDTDGIINAIIIKHNNVRGLVNTGPSGWVSDAPLWGEGPIEITPQRNENDFRALLASPNGSGVAYYLIQHKQAFGHNHVSRIQIFSSNGNNHLLFTIRASSFS